MKKRSLFAATSMLLVALLVATGSTYAWFTSQSAAKTAISMEVSKGTSLEISKAGANNWKSALGNSDFDIDTEMWGDYTFDGSFKTKTLDSDGNVNGNQASTPVAISIDIRSTKGDDVTVALSSLAFSESVAEKYNKVINNARVTVATGDTPTYTHLANAKGTYSLDAADATGLQPNYATATSATIALVGNGSGQANAAGYYTGTATFYFWVEGTALDNADVNELAKALGATLTFDQPTS